MNEEHRNYLIIFASIIVILALPHVVYANPKVYADSEECCVVIERIEDKWIEEGSYVFNYNVDSTPLFTHQQLQFTYAYNLTENAYRLLKTKVKAYVNGIFIGDSGWDFLNVRGTWGVTPTFNINNKDVKMGENCIELHYVIESAEGPTLKKEDRVAVKYYDITVSEVNGPYYKRGD